VYSIGEFSKITGLTVKTLRFYHEQRLLIPACIDDESGYRYYKAEQIERARTIAYLRGLEFSLSEIGEMLKSDGDGPQVLERLERQKGAIEARIRQLKKAARSLNQFIVEEREAQTAMATSSFEVHEKLLPAMLIAGIRMRGKYCDCGQAFSRIGKSLGRYICGKPFLLHYDSEYHEEGADFEACMPVRQARQVEGMSLRELAGGRCVALAHRGPYDQLGRSYARILDYAKQHGLEIELPTREVYLKGPGMIFQGNPKNYLTEIQLPIANGRK